VQLTGSAGFCHRHPANPAAAGHPSRVRVLRCSLSPSDTMTAVSACTVRRSPAAAKIRCAARPVIVRSLTVTVHDEPCRPRPQGTHRGDYPSVATWLDGADSSHWWVRLVDTQRDPAVTPPTLADTVLGPLEILVQAVRGASPKRLEQFVSSRFRDPDPANLLSARLELLCAANLAIRHVPFEFGGKAEPDLTWNPCTGAQGRLEIHRGAFSVFDDLQQALDKELDAKGAILTVRLREWPLGVPGRNLLCTRISKAIGAAAASGSSQVVAMPELGDGVTGVIESRQEIPGIGRIFTQHPGITPSEGYLASVATRLARKVNEDKAAQGRKGNWDPAQTALLIDISTAHLVQLLGRDGLAAWLDDVPVDWEDLPFSAVAACFSHLHGLFPWGSCRYRPDLDIAQRARLEPVLSALGLPATPGYPQACR
jgi:hypothetical protein